MQQQREQASLDAIESYYSCRMVLERNETKMADAPVWQPGSHRYYSASRDVKLDNTGDLLTSIGHLILFSDMLQDHSRQFLSTDAF